MRLDRIIRGAIAGGVGTLPMTAFMQTLHSRLPSEHKYPLPPYEITTELTRRTRIRKLQRNMQGLTLLSHFGYGAAAGAVYGALRMRSGLLFGTAVWLVSYLGLLPALGILKPATKHPLSRNALMLAAHWVWGFSLSRVETQLARSTAVATSAMHPAADLRDVAGDRPVRPVRPPSSLAPSPTSWLRRPGNRRPRSLS